MTKEEVKAKYGLNVDFYGKIMTDPIHSTTKNGNKMTKLLFSVSQKKEDKWLSLSFNGLIFNDPNSTNLLKSDMLRIQGTLELEKGYINKDGDAVNMHTIIINSYELDSTAQPYKKEYITKQETPEYTPEDDNVPF